MPMTVSGTAGLTFPDTSTQAKSAANGQTGSAPFYSARAWVNFNGTGTVAIRASGNVSSITDGGTGIYTVNFTTAMPDADYSVAAAGCRSSGIVPLISAPVQPGSYTTSAVTVRTMEYDGSSADSLFTSVAVFR
jgi:hypothetical protein